MAKCNKWSNCYGGQIGCSSRSTSIHEIFHCLYPMRQMGTVVCCFSWQSWPHFSIEAFVKVTQNWITNISLYPHCNHHMHHCTYQYLTLIKYSMLLLTQLYGWMETNAGECLQVRRWKHDFDIARQHYADFCSEIEGSSYCRTEPNWEQLAPTWFSPALDLDYLSPLRFLGSEISHTLDLPQPGNLRNIPTEAIQIWPSATTMYREKLVNVVNGPLVFSLKPYSNIRNEILHTPFLSALPRILRLWPCISVFSVSLLVWYSTLTSFARMLTGIMLATTSIGLSDVGQKILQTLLTISR